MLRGGADAEPRITGDGDPGEQEEKTKTQAAPGVERRRRGRIQTKVWLEAFCHGHLLARPVPDDIRDSDTGDR